MVHLGHSALHWKLRAESKTSTQKSCDGKSGDYKSCGDKNWDDTSCTGTTTPPWMSPGFTDYGYSRSNTNPPSPSPSPPHSPSSAATVLLPSRRPLEVASPTTSAPVMQETTPRPSPLVGTRTKALQSCRSRREAAAPYSRPRLFRDQKGHSVTNPSGCIRAANVEPTGPRLRSGRTADMLVPVLWPQEVAYLREQYNPMAEVVLAVLHFGSCNCHDACRFDTCGNALMNVYCNMNCCPYEGMCGNGLQKSNKEETCAAATGGGGLESFGFVSQEMNYRFQWLQWIVERNLPITEVDNELTLSMSKWPPVFSKTLKKCMHTVAKDVGAAIEHEIGTSFALMFDCWSHGSAVLRIYNKTTDMVTFIVGDNCNTNQKIATLLGVPLVGCASHRFNLAINPFHAEYEAELATVNDLMIQLRHCNNAARLGELTDLQPVKRNATRWSSTYAMVDRYVRIRDAIRQVEAAEDYVPSGVSHKKLVTLLAELEKHDTVCTALQHERTTLADVRLLFDKVIAYYPIMADHLRASAKIVHSPTFESALVKIGNGDTLATTEARAVKCFEVANDAEGDGERGGPGAKGKKKLRCDSAHAILHDGKKRRVSTRTQTRYSALARLVPPTSNTVEQLFSTCKLSMTP
ncbi:hypothetical protein F444_03769 [Phytophthora nicotianae P1976]|uniref:Uncharacterized protein n=1 Tax=Phytophthora nicotianae P1976 TaxID=1317066 RepID=A0A081ASZ2_PHYNI|nr:hypothetical protein F444_03769 [Phytophthora nicotianae P1976]